MIWSPKRRGRARRTFSIACYSLVLSFTLAPAGTQPFTISTIAGGTQVATPASGVGMWIGAVSN
jgi:hypothetical protein